MQIFGVILKQLLGAGHLLGGGYEGRGATCINPSPESTDPPQLPVRLLDGDNNEQDKHSPSLAASFFSPQDPAVAKEHLAQRKAEQHPQLLAVLISAERRSCLYQPDGTDNPLGIHKAQLEQRSAAPPTGFAASR